MDNKIEIVKACLKLTDYTFNMAADGFEVVLIAPGLGKVKCKFEYEIILREGDHDD